LTIAYREERETWAAELGGWVAIPVFERDFGGHVYQEKLHHFCGGDVFADPSG
jgi:hypothetical protein